MTDARAGEMRSLTSHISGIPLTPARLTARWWLGAALLAILLLLLFFYAVVVLFSRGVGIWGIDVPVAWGFAITNFVWWIGIGHAGTLISAILLLCHQQWRRSISRFAETMTLFAVACAGLFPILHLGRPDRFYYLLPYPNSLDVWPQWRSPLVWDVFAVLTYLTVSLLFWYVSLIPDLATQRDRARPLLVRRLYGFFALGWRSSARHWRVQQNLTLLLAGIATPLVVSVHSIVSLDFAISLLPGWHTTVFPPYFVAGAVFSGFAMVLTLLIPLRSLLRLHAYVTPDHLDAMAKLTLATGLFVAFGYLSETFTAWYSGNPYEIYMSQNRMTGPYAPFYWLLLLCNVVAPQILWFRRARRSVWLLFALSIVINLGMWLERFVIVVTSLHRDFVPSSWGMFFPTFWDWATLAGSLGLFLLGMLLFLRLLPVISMFELRELVGGGHGRQSEKGGRDES